MRLRLNGFGPPFLDRFATVSDRFSGSWCRFLESWGQDGGNSEKTGKTRRKMGEKWPKESGSNDRLTANAEYKRRPPMPHLTLARAALVQAASAVSLLSAGVNSYRAGFDMGDEWGLVGEAIGGVINCTTVILSRSVLCPSR